MIKICFVCLGNICRSPMAEFMFKDKIRRRNLVDHFFITSRATSYEEQGNPMHNGTVKVLEKNNILYDDHSAKRLEKSDYDKYDYFICMDDSNVSNALCILGDDIQNKIFKLNDKDVSDPWYTRDFEKTFFDINIGLENLLDKVNIR